MFDWGSANETCRKIAGLPVGAASDEDLVEAAREIEALRCLFDAGQGRVLAELDVRATCDREYGLSTASWLAREARLPRNVAALRVRVGKKLCSLLPGVRGVG